MTATDNPGLAEQVAAVLAGHAQDRGHRDMRAHCVCGWTGVTGGGGWTSEHRDHQAAQLVPLIEAREQEAALDAWDQGYSAALMQSYTHIPVRNPYYAEEDL